MTDYQFYMLLATAAGPVVELAVGGAQCLLIFIGLRQMREDSREHEKLREARMAGMKSRRAETMATHTETMAAMERQHAENMAALKEFIRRTGNGVE